jgi:glycerophosphoryl diester phosphodiesterase
LSPVATLYQQQRPEYTDHVRIFGHRGAPGYPRTAENTIGSFKKALQCGAHGVEFDVRRCADGRIVVIHDETIDRTTNGSGLVAKLTYDQLQQFDAGFGEPIPLLTDVLDTFGGQFLLHIELKDAGMANDVKNAVLGRNLQERVIISCFEWLELKPFPPEVPIALLSSSLPNLVSSATELGATAIHPCRDIVTPELIEAAHSANLQINVWTINDPAEVPTFRRLGVDAIFSDFPERCLTFAS